MALESGTFIDSLNANNPAITDQIDQGDDHIRLIKSTIKSTFPSVTGAVTLTHTQINALETRLGIAETDITSLNAGVVGNDNDLATLDAGKANIAGDAFTGSISTTGNLTVSGSTSLQAATVVAPAAADNSTSIPSTAWVTTELASFTPLAGGTMTGELALGTNKITGLGTPTADADASTKKYVDDQLAALATTPTMSHRSSISFSTGTRTKGQSTNTVTYTVNTPGNYVEIELTLSATVNTGAQQSNENSNPGSVTAQGFVVIDSTNYNVLNVGHSGFAGNVSKSDRLTARFLVATPSASTSFGFFVKNSSSSSNASTVSGPSFSDVRIYDYNRTDIT